MIHDDEARTLLEGDVNVLRRELSALEGRNDADALARRPAAQKSLAELEGISLSDYRRKHLAHLNLSAI